MSRRLVVRPPLGELHPAASSLWSCSAAIRRARSRSMRCLWGSALIRFALAIDKSEWPEESEDMPRWPENPDDDIDPAIAPLIEAGEGEAEGFDVAEADLIRHAEHGDEQGTDPIWRDAAGFRAEEIPGLDADRSGAADVAE